MKTEKKERRKKIRRVRRHWQSSNIVAHEPSLTLWSGKQTAHFFCHPQSIEKSIHRNWKSWKQCKSYINCRKIWNFRFCVWHLQWMCLCVCLCVCARATVNSHRRKHWSHTETQLFSVRPKRRSDALQCSEFHSWSFDSFFSSDKNIQFNFNFVCGDSYSCWMHLS